MEPLLVRWRLLFKDDEAYERSKKWTKEKVEVILRERKLSSDTFDIEEFIDELEAKHGYFQQPGSPPPSSRPFLAITPNTLESKIRSVIREENSKQIGRSHTPSSYSERYGKLNNQGVSHFWFGENNNISPKVKTNLGQSLSNGASETNFVQPRWDKLIELIRAHEKELKSEIWSRFKTNSLGDRKPDVVGYETGGTRTEYYITFIGELKARRGVGIDSFTDEEKGQIQSYLEDLLFLYQIHRHEVTGFLSDGVLIQFFRFNRNREWFESSCDSLSGKGGRHLMSLLKKSSAELGMTPPFFLNNTRVIIEKLLGRGGTSTVFAGKLEGSFDTWVVKSFHQDHLDRLVVEETNLRLMEPLLGLKATKLIGRTDDQTALIVSPVGSPFVSSLDDGLHYATADHFKQLIEIIQIVHQYGFVHRDLTLVNFFSVPGTETVFLNDWGCAAIRGEETQFRGSLQLAPDDILGMFEAGTKIHTPKPSDDLVMIVKCLFWRLNPRFYQMPDVTGDQSPQKIRQLRAFWDRELEPKFWKDLIEIATDQRRENPYLAMINVIANVLA